jgi:hypothetical protein
MVGGEGGDCFSSTKGTDHGQSGENVVKLVSVVISLARDCQSLALSLPHLPAKREKEN